MKKRLIIALAMALAILPASTSAASQTPTESNTIDLTGVAGISATDAFAVGTTSGTNVESVARPLIQQFNGSTWTVSPSAALSASGGLSGVAATSANNVWTVGGSESTPLIEHYNGTEWTRVASPVEEPAVSTLLAVSTDAPSDAWAVGESAGRPGADEVLVEHWNGTKWTVVKGVRKFPVGASEESPDRVVTSVDALAPNDVWITGKVGSKQPNFVIEHFNGSKWSIVKQPIVDKHRIDPLINSVSGSSSEDVWVVGETGSEPFAEHWNGTEFTVVPVPKAATPSGAASSSDELVGVTDLGVDDVWAVGKVLPAGEPTSSLIEHFNGSSWSVVPDPSDAPPSLTAVSGVAEGPVFAVDARGDESTTPLTIEN
jgi:hypothetical protein